MMQRFYAEQTGASWCVRDHEIVTPFGPARGKPMLVQWCSGQALAESLAKMLNETRGHARTGECIRAKGFEKNPVGHHASLA